MGRLEPGRYADLVLLDYEKMTFPFTDPAHDPLEVLLYRGKGSHVHTVMVSGKIVVQKGNLLTLDEEAIGKKLQEAASLPPGGAEMELERAVLELREKVVAYYCGWEQKIEKTPYFGINSREDGLK